MADIKITNNYNRTYTISEIDKFWQRVLGSGIYQIGNLRMLQRTRPNARTIVDVGANIGSNTIEYACWADRVISYEPTPELYQRLLTNIQNNKTNPDTKRWDPNVSMIPKANIITHNNALGEKEKNVKIKCHENNKGKNYISDEGIDILVKTLDQYQLTEVDIIKIDVEGYELNVLMGAEDTIQRNRPIIQTELHKGLLKRQGTTIQEIAEWFYARNYVAVDRENKLQPQILPTNHSGIDLFWLPK